MRERALPISIWKLAGEPLSVDREADIHRVSFCVHEPGGGKHHSDQPQVHGFGEFLVDDEFGVLRVRGQFLQIRFGERGEKLRLKARGVFRIAGVSRPDRVLVALYLPE